MDWNEPQSLFWDNYSLWSTRNLLCIRYDLKDQLTFLWQDSISFIYTKFLHIPASVSCQPRLAIHHTLFLSVQLNDRVLCISYSEKTTLNGTDVVAQCLQAQHFGGWGRERIDINLSLAGLMAKSVFQKAKLSKTRVWGANNMAALAWSQTASGWIATHSELSLTWPVSFKEGHIILPPWIQALAKHRILAWPLVADRTPGCEFKSRPKQCPDKCFL